MNHEQIPDRREKDGTFLLVADFSRYKNSGNGEAVNNVVERQPEVLAKYQESKLRPMEDDLIEKIKNNDLTTKTPYYDDGGDNYVVYKFSYTDAVGKVFIQFQDGGTNDGLFFIHYDKHDKQSDIVRAEKDSLMLIHDSNPSVFGKGEPIFASRAPGMPLPNDVYESYRNLLQVGLKANSYSLLELQMKEA